MGKRKLSHCTRGRPCRACGGRVISNWEFDYPWPDGVARTRMWHCLGCGRAAPEKLEAPEASKEVRRG